MRTKKINYILFLFMLVKPYHSYGQYQSIFGNLQTSWNIKTDHVQGIITDSLVYSGDTTINGVVHKEIKYFRKPFEITGLIGYIEEDTVTGRAWYFNEDDTLKRLFMDLSLSVNDTFKPFCHFNPACIVDSVYVISGRKNVSLKGAIFPDNPNFTMIEGVGTNIGILYNNLNGGINPFLLCQYKDDSLNFTNTHPVYSGLCSYYTGIEENYTLKSDLKIFPNPNSGHFNIEIESQGQVLLSVYNMLGNLVYEQVIRSSGIIPISLPESLPSGVYLLKYNSRDVRVSEWFVLRRD